MVAHSQVPTDSPRVDSPRAAAAAASLPTSLKGGIAKPVPKHRRLEDDHRDAILGSPMDYDDDDDDNDDCGDDNDDYSHVKSDDENGENGGNDNEDDDDLQVDSDADECDIGSDVNDSDVSDEDVAVIEGEFDDDDEDEWDEQKDTTFCLEVTEMFKEFERLYASRLKGQPLRTNAPLHNVVESLKNKVLPFVRRCNPLLDDDEEQVSWGRKEVLWAKAKWTKAEGSPKALLDELDGSLGEYGVKTLEFFPEEMKRHMRHMRSVNVVYNRANDGYDEPKKDRLFDAMHKLVTKAWMAKCFRVLYCGPTPTEEALNYTTVLCWKLMGHRVIHINDEE